MASPKIKDLIISINDFLDSTDRNRWIYSGSFEIYVRKTHHLVRGEVVPCFDIATINERNCKRRGKGFFTNLLQNIETEIPSEFYIYVENVMNPRLGTFLLRRGYEPTGTNEYLTSFYLPKTQ